MPFVAEFTTDGRSKMLYSGHVPNEDKDAIQKFEKQAIEMTEARRFPVHLQVLHNGLRDIAAVRRLVPVWRKAW